MDKCLPFFKMLKQAFAWTNEYERAFQQRESFPRAQVLPEPSTPLEPIQGRRRLVFILSSVSYNCERNFDSRREHKIALGLLRQLGLPKGRSQIPTDREYCICFDCSLTQAAPLLLGEPYLGDDELTNKEVNEQARGCRKDDPV